jgi:hypothetical protein
MVNTGTVNGEPGCVPRALFCEFFRAFARFPRFQNPVKYSAKLRVNHILEACGLGARPLLLWNIHCFQCDIPP